MRYFCCILLASIRGLSANLTWSSPATLFSSADESAVLPQLVALPSSQAAVAVWAVEEGSVYTKAFAGGSWGDLATLASASSVGELEFKLGSQGNQVVVWTDITEESLVIQGRENLGAGWGSPVTLQNLVDVNGEVDLRLFAGDGAVSVVSWIEDGGILKGATYKSGDLLGVYSLSGSGIAALSSALAEGVAFFATTTGLYGVTFDPENPSGAPVDTAIFPRSVEIGGFDLWSDSAGSRVAGIFQDMRTLFLIVGLNSGSGWTLQTAGTPGSAAVEAKVVLSGNTPGAAAIWQLTNGSIQAAISDGTSWGNFVALSTNGASPVIAYNPKTAHVIAAWADRVAGGDETTIQVAEFNRVSWSSPAEVSSGGYLVDAPSLAINAQGNAFLTWIRKEEVSSKAIVEAALGN